MIKRLPTLLPADRGAWLSSATKYARPAYMSLGLGVRLSQP
jgi:hypothetical protein